VYVVLFPAIPLLGGGPRPWRCCVAGLLSCGHSFTESFKLLWLSEDCVFWNFQNVHKGKRLRLFMKLRGKFHE
jgi:hypothetical protein